MATAKEILDKAISYIGTKEFPANSNNVIFNTHYYGKSVSGAAYPWCAVFVWDVFRMCKSSSLFCGGNKNAYCPTIENYYKSIGSYYSKSQGIPGDLCIMDFGKGRASHIGIVEKKNADGSYNIIEGNTSTSSNDNGGCVMRRIRGTSVIRGFCRPKYKSVKNVSTTHKKYNKIQFIKDVQLSIGAKADGIVGGETLSKLVTLSKTKRRKHKIVKYIQKYLEVIGYSVPVSGVFDKTTYIAVKNFQKKNKLTVDGVIGINTWKKLFFT